MNKIEKILIGGRAQVANADRAITFVSGVNQNSVNVICGKNRTGKTHILKNAYRAALKFDQSIDQGKHGPDNSVEGDVRIYTVLQNQKFGTPLFFGEMDRLLSLPRSISIQTDSSFTRGIPKDETRNLHLLRNALDKFCSDQINAIFIREGISTSNNHWETDDLRYNTMQNLSFESIYLLDQEHEVVKCFQTIAKGKLYLGIVDRDKQGRFLTLHLSHDGRDSFSFGRWSDGQKVFFISVLLTYNYKPSVIFFDEIENHLHPEYISQLLEYFKKNVPQTIITSHHPHLIFSKYVDDVNYIEVDPVVNDQTVLTRTHRSITKPLIRKVYKLEKNYSKLLSAYKLFDTYDDQLIRLSSSVLSDLDESLTQAFTNLFNYDILPASGKRKFDLQSDKLHKLLSEKKSQGKTYNVLDFGAGKGRLLLNLNEIDANIIDKNFHWTLYEPFDAVREELKKNIQRFSLDTKITITGKLDFTQKYDLILMANVLHELPPNILASIFSESCKLLKDDGELMIIELYPLVLPEKFSLPLKSEEWLELFRKLKWKGVKDNTIFRYAEFEASWIQLTKTKDSLTDSYKILPVIEKFWKQVLKTRSQDYAGRKSLGAIENSMKVMCELTSIASIVSYLNGEWKME